MQPASRSGKWDGRHQEPSLGNMEAMAFPMVAKERLSPF
jgi:hypothetical protein